MGSRTPSQAPGEALRPTYHRLVVKVGTNVITHHGEHLDLQTMASLVEQLALLHRSGVKVVVVSSGAIASGRHVLGLRVQEEKGVVFRQVLAAVGQSYLMQAYSQLFFWHGLHVAQALLTRHDLSDRKGYLNARSALSALLELDVVPIVNENDVVATEEIDEVFGDNDTLSAHVANLVDAELLVILTDTEGLYTADPHRDPSASLIRRVDRIDEQIEGLVRDHVAPWARGGIGTKIEAARLATASGIGVVVCNGREPEVLLRIARGEEVGTYFRPATSLLEARKRWMLSGLSVRGEIAVDRGAVEALQSGRVSLLPAGVVEVRGHFQRGDLVNVVGPRGERVACGIVNYDSDALRRIQGRRSDRIRSILGYDYGQEVVHRNNMVLLTPARST